MAHLLDTLVVGLVLAASAGYAMFTLGPKSWRGAVASRLGVLAPRLPTRLGMRRAVQRLSDSMASKAGGACGGCDNCGSESASKPVSGTTAAPNTAGEVRIGVAHIGRRR